MQSQEAKLNKVEHQFQAYVESQEAQRAEKLNLSLESIACSHQTKQLIRETLTESKKTKI